MNTRSAGRGERGVGKKYNVCNFSVFIPNVKLDIGKGRGRGREKRGKGRERKARANLGKKRKKRRNDPPRGSGMKTVHIK